MIWRVPIKVADLELAGDEVGAGQRSNSQRSRKPEL